MLYLRELRGAGLEFSLSESLRRIQLETVVYFACFNEKTQRNITRIECVKVEGAFNSVALFKYIKQSKVKN